MFLPSFNSGSFLYVFILLQFFADVIFTSISTSIRRAYTFLIQNRSFSRDIFVYRRYEMFFYFHLLIWFQTQSSRWVSLLRTIRRAKWTKEENEEEEKGKTIFGSHKFNCWLSLIAYFCSRWRERFFMVHLNSISSSWVLTSFFSCCFFFSSDFVSFIFSLRILQVMIFWKIVLWVHPENTSTEKKSYYIFFSSSSLEWIVRHSALALFKSQK